MRYSFNPFQGVRPFGLPLVAVFALALAASAAPPAVPSSGALPRLAIKGMRLVDPAGKTVLLRGVNLGSWLLLESHFTGFAFRDEKSLWAGLERRFGHAKMVEIREAYRTNWITAADFRRVKGLGFNHVRIPFWYGLLEEEARPGKYIEEGWRWLDNAVNWSEEAGLYCILDLHGVAGGQSKSDHAGERDRNAYWSDVGLRRRAANLWAAVAKRYKGRATIAAFDLLNEPMGAPNGPAVLAAQAELLQAVRQADPKRLVIIEEGYKGLSLFPRLAGPDRERVIYSQHHYPTMGAKKASPEIHEAFLRDRFPVFAREQKRFGQPLYIGEWNVIQEAAGGGPMCRKHIEAMERAGWSWALWIYKQANKSPVHECWSCYRNNKNLDMPDVEHDDAAAILTKLQQLRTENMVVYEPLRRAVMGEAP